MRATAARAGTARAMSRLYPCFWIFIGNPFLPSLRSDTLPGKIHPATCGRTLPGQRTTNLPRRCASFHRYSGTSPNPLGVEPPLLHFRTDEEKVCLVLGASETLMLGAPPLHFDGSLNGFQVPKRSNGLG